MVGVLTTRALMFRLYLRASSFWKLPQGSVVTWGDPDHGGSSSGVQHKLRDVQHVESSGGAFAAAPWT